MFKIYYFLLNSYGNVFGQNDIEIQMSGLEK